MEENSEMMQLHKTVFLVNIISKYITDFYKSHSEQEKKDSEKNEKQEEEEQQKFMSEMKAKTTPYGIYMMINRDEEIEVTVGNYFARLKLDKKFKKNIPKVIKKLKIKV